MIMHPCEVITHTFMSSRRKSMRSRGSGHVVVNIPGTLLNSSFKQKLGDDHKSVKVGSLQIEKSLRKPVQRHCRKCEGKFYNGNMGTTRVAIYRPAMLSMVAIAAISVCSFAIQKLTRGSLCVQTFQVGAVEVWFQLNANVMVVQECRDRYP